MAYPYKKMTEEDFDYIRSVTSPDRVAIGEEIATEYYRDEMPEYAFFRRSSTSKWKIKKKFLPSWHMLIKKIFRLSAVVPERALPEALRVSTAASCSPLCA